VRATLADVSERRSCRVLGISRAALPRPARGPVGRRVPAPPWVARLRALIQHHPTFGSRQPWALLRGQEGLVVNRTTVYRVLKLKRWLVHQRPCTPRPRVRGWVSRASRSNERWAMDVTHIPCGLDGWAHLAAVMDCHNRELIGSEFALRGRAKEASARSKRPAWRASGRSGRRAGPRRCAATTA
jgi:putative transposase